MKVRNKGYSGEVSGKLLKELVSLNGRIGFRGYTKNDIVERSNGVLTYSPTNIVNNKIVNYKNDTYISQDKYKESPEIMVKNNDILFVKTGSTLGKSALVRNLTEPATINPQLIVIKTIHVDSDYLAVYLLTDSIQKQVFQVKIGGAVPTLTETEIGKFVVKLPPLPEQSAIGSLFRTLDDLLASYKDNLANYQSLKATMLSKMFPKAGQTAPEIRLDGFEGEWGNAKIKDHVTLLNGRAFKQDELLDKGKYRVVRVGNFNTNDKWYYSNLELEENKYAYKGDLLYLWATNFGPEIWDKEKIIFHYHIWKFEFDRSIIDRDYLYYWLERDKERIKQNTNGSTMVHVTKSMMENREFLFPMFKEQQAIGSYFSNLDNLISAHQEKISQLETLKKKLLQDMFI